MDKGWIGRRAALAIERAAFDACRPVREILAETGIDKNLYYAWRAGKNEPAAYALAKLADYGVDIRWILLGEEAGR